MINAAFKALLPITLLAVVLPAAADIHKCVKDGKTVFQQLPCEQGAQDKPLAGSAPADAFEGCFYLLPKTTKTNLFASSDFIDRYEIKRTAAGRYSYTAPWGQQTLKELQKESPDTAPVAGKMVTATPADLASATRMIGTRALSGVVDADHYGNESDGHTLYRSGVFRTDQGYFSTFGAPVPVNKKPCPGTIEKQR